MIILELSDEEALNLRNLLDVAVRAGGMRAAEVAVPLDRRIIEAAQRQAKPNGGDNTMTITAGG
jgi:hypothetical protein